ncbi:MAG: ATP-binding protein [Flavobacteriales bacterium]|nr:ATP-binding protein [Flavobacteriales bacterium]
MQDVDLQPQNTFNSEIQTAMFIGALLFAVVAAFVIFFIFRYRQKQVEHTREKEQLQQQMESEMLRSQIEISEQVVQRISQELHDNIAQTLTIAKFYLSNGDATTQQTRMQSSKELVARAIHELRDLSQSLNGNYVLELGLEEAVKRELALFPFAEKSLEILLPENLNDQQQIILFRCLQESLNNILKHANAKKTEVKLKQEGEKILLSISDDGIGFSNHTSTNGLGLTSMKQRVQLLRGTFEMKQEAGTTIRITLPVEP